MIQFLGDSRASAWFIGLPVSRFARGLFVTALLLAALSALFKEQVACVASGLLILVAEGLVLAAFYARGPERLRR